MSDRSWFFAAGDQQRGPYGEVEFRDLIARGAVTAETLVWTQGMAGWQKAGEIPGFLSGSPASYTGGFRANHSASGAALSAEMDIWPLTWRTIVVSIGALFIIPVPWVITMYCRWIVSCVRVPQRPNLGFTGQAVTLTWFFAAVALLVVIGIVGPRLLDFASFIVEMVLYWLLVRWFVANLSSNGQALGLSFSGSFWGFVGWNILAGLAVFTIIGWAWVYTAQVRWMCRHIEGTRRAVVFKATGLEFLWRALVTVIGSLFIIPAPWLVRWLFRWQVSQVELAEGAEPAA